MTAFNDDHPIVLALAGRAGSGKSTVASALGPRASFVQHFLTEENSYPIYWDTVSLAAPLYRLASTRSGISGTARQDRIYYEILATLLDTYGSSPLFGAPPFHSLLKLIEELATHPIQDNGSKPREFLQWAGQRLRTEHPDCLTQRLSRTISSHWYEYLRDQDAEWDAREEEDPDIALVPRYYGAIVPDLRLPTEAAWLLERETNCLLVKLVCEEATRTARIQDRDEGFWGDVDHPTETGIDLIPDDWCAAIIDTTEMTKEEQINAFRELGALYVDHTFIPERPVLTHAENES